VHGFAVEEIVDTPNGVPDLSLPVFGGRGLG
jgi:hypothetical protein